VEPDGPLAAVLAEMVGAGAVAAPDRPGTGEVEALAAGARDRARAGRRLHARSGGNPFLVEQLCDLDDLSVSGPAGRAALLQGRLRGLEQDWP
jgi:hypothetical protein